MWEPAHTGASLPLLLFETARSNLGGVENERGGTKEEVWTSLDLKQATGAVYKAMGPIFEIRIKLQLSFPPNLHSFQESTPSLHISGE